MHVEWDDVDPDTKILRLRSKVKKWGFRQRILKNGNWPIYDELLNQLKDYQKDYAGRSTLIFPQNGQPDGHMLRTLKRLVRKYGLNCGRCDGCQRERPDCGNWYLHKFRATYCTKLLRSGVDMRTVQAMMGHSDLASTMRYLRPAENEQTQARINAMKWY